MPMITIPIPRVNPYRLPSILWRDKSELPLLSGIYFVLDGVDILYVGKAKNLRRRWQSNSHHRYAAIAHLQRIIDDSKLGEPIKIAWVECPEEYLSQLEREMIKQFNPRFNSKPVRTFICVPSK